MTTLRMPSQEEDEAITAAAESDPDNPPWTDEDFRRASIGASRPTEAAAIPLRVAIATLERSTGAERDELRPTIERLRTSLKRLERFKKGR